MPRASQVFSFEQQARFINMCACDDDGLDSLLASYASERNSSRSLSDLMRGVCPLHYSSTYILPYILLDQDRRLHVLHGLPTAEVRLGLMSIAYTCTHMYVWHQMAVHRTKVLNLSPATRRRWQGRERARGPERIRACKIVISAVRWGFCKHASLHAETKQSSQARQWHQLLSRGRCRLLQAPCQRHHPFRGILPLQLRHPSSQRALSRRQRRRPRGFSRACTLARSATSCLKALRLSEVRLVWLRVRE